MGGSNNKNSGALYQQGGTGIRWWMGQLRVAELRSKIAEPLQFMPWRHIQGGGDLFDLGRGCFEKFRIHRDIDTQLTRIFVGVCGGGAAIFRMFSVGVLICLSGGRRVTGTMLAHLQGSASFFLNAPHIRLQTGYAAEKEYPHESKGDNMSNRHSIHGVYISNLTISRNN